MKETEQGKLHFGHTSDPPDLSELDVRRVHPDELLGQPAVFTVIGESHYVGLPALGFHELCSCTPLGGTSHRIPLSIGSEREFRFEGDQITARTAVVGQPLDSFPGPEGATVAHRFGSEAWTTITVAEQRFETYHTYPELDLGLATETRLIKHD